MTLDQFRPQVQGIIQPVVNLMRKIGVTPNGLSLASFFVSALAGIAFYAGGVVLGVVMVALNAVFDALDGALARDLGIAGRRGDFLDHVIDRYADIFIITGIFAGGAASWPIGVFALTGVLMSSYLGTQAQAVGVGRFYGGILGRADRLVLIIIAGVLTILIPGEIYGLNYLGWLLVIFGILGHYTALQRFAHVWRQIEKH
ncbi:MULTISPECIES: CDP-alcohol phosphatidyltransferase family protein [unclassified Methanoculleus]|jgi:archaetidylinositol phosphate synthase|uniref:CDP-alcohol phosphatidyltransferase family protein n=1 Tax=unclassified Methanoculleus TaxID=2619537 RepID=UPI002600C62A|nr:MULTISPECIES: CDP-alcohol phosphatidyltransferase family protein [unclassified Methanoculleus]MCK9318253.1 CDP-alcohol phosphatidyltransferase family protein [Methanoculleus sp.]MDD2255190.1 CDP-alcohol phosphatidyltransferase family protein [Methanoculleus sp.]MDD2786928.1 CDP-alcohol phosphatidyltransferase family protein [Methanoculleus sp.]MDD3216924.1 CDP-alcohol phosphatidyltransferase family protein [Methanoculleus sp.]MDD4314669.1 CDP-alcohol phosphatidyltransferase family protein [